MATNTMETDNKKKELKHLEFVKIATINTLICLSNLYEYAKQNSGSLKSGIRTVEGTVRTVIGPVYEKFKGVPQDLLVFLDTKVDEATKKLDEHAPPLAKQVASTACRMVQKASQLTKALVSEARTRGVPVAAHNSVKKSEQYLSEKAVKVWFKLNKIPAFQMVVDVVVPTAAQWSDKYNQVVASKTREGYTIFSYLPLIPIGKIAKAFKKREEEAVKEAVEPIS